MNRDLLPGIEIVIMAHHRQDETLRAIQALKKVNFGIPTFIKVSDNPSTLSQALEEIPSDVSHVVRNPPLASGLLHMNQIFSEAKYEWTLLTHDDDEMLPALGNIFRAHNQDLGVSVITGRSQIVQNGSPVVDKSYEKRLEVSQLIYSKHNPHFDLVEKLLDIGPLFPASAIITRSELILQIGTLNPDWALAGDLGHSIAVSERNGVVFEGTECVMNYHIHSNNSVFSVDAAGGLMADFTITRLDYFTRNLDMLNRTRILQLSKALFISRVLAKSFHLDSRFKSVSRYARNMNSKSSKFRISFIVFVPLPLGPLKPIVRRLMWKRLGVNKWGY